MYKKQTAIHRKPIELLFMSIIDKFGSMAGTCERCHKAETTQATLSLYSQLYQQKPTSDEEADRVISQEIQRQQKGEFIPSVTMRICQNCVINVASSQGDIATIAMMTYAMTPDMIQRIILPMWSEPGAKGDWAPAIGVQYAGDTRTLQQVYNSMLTNRPQNIEKTGITFA